jgi:hypothetical protein
VNFKLEKEDLDTIQMMASILELDDEACNQRQYNKVLKFIKRLNDQIPQPVTTTTRRIKVFK